MERDIIPEQAELSFRGLVFLCVLAILLSLSSYFFSPFLLRYFVHSSEIYCAVIDYLDWRCFGLLFSFPFLAFRSFLYWYCPNQCFVMGGTGSRSNKYSPVIIGLFLFLIEE